MAPNSLTPAQSLENALAQLARTLVPSAVEGIIARLDAGQSGSAINYSLNTSAARQVWKPVELAWQHHATVPGPALALALRTALRQMEHHQQNAVELVWTGPQTRHSDWRRSEQALLQLIGSAKKSLWLVTFAAYRVSTVVAALDKAVAAGVQVRFVAETPDTGKIKTSGGGPLSWLPQGVEIYAWPGYQRERNAHGDFGTLHAKLAVADYDLALISSANLTDCALDFNIESGVLLHGLAAERIARQLETLVQTKVWVPVER